MLIQPLLFPDKKYSIEPELFFHGTFDGNIAAGNTVSIESYFNAFSIGKWREYTNLNNLSLRLEIEGDVEIKAYHAVGSVDENFLQKGQGKLTEVEYIDLVNTKGYRAERTEVEVTSSRADNVYTIKFVQLPEDGILFVTIKAISDAKLIGGGYHTQVDETLLNPVKIAVGICTFKREEFVKRNVKFIKDDLIDKADSPLYDKLEVYIADNGQTLDKASFADEKIHLLPNPNLGGAGGFTRTMIEAMFHDKAKCFTHIIFMDDDILLYPPVLERTYHLFRMLKPEYQKAILGAGMFLLDQPCLQQETGAIYKDTITYIGKANHKLFDLRIAGAVSANEVVDPTNYTGWWYACIPKTIVTEQNLPMPFFIHYDDAEYGVRNVAEGNEQIFLNGICVWHPSPANKGPLWITYYNVRNRLITMFTHNLSESSLRKYSLAIAKLFLFNLVCYEYKKTQLMIDAMQDFLKGPEDFINKDALKLHAKLSEFKQENSIPEKAGADISKMIEDTHPNFALAGIEQVLCNLLPGVDKTCVIAQGVLNIPHRAKRLYFYNKKTRNGYLLERNQKLLFKQFFDFMKTVLKLLHNHNSLLAEWQKARTILTSLPFWERYLNLDS